MNYLCISEYKSEKVQKERLGDIVKSLFFSPMLADTASSTVDFTNDADCVTSINDGNIFVNLTQKKRSGSGKTD